MTLRWAVILLAVGALAGCGGGAAGTGHVHGTVTLGPTTPVCRKGVPCSKPASGARVTFTAVDGSATTVVTASDGTYSVSLAPGVYGIAVSGPPPSGHGINSVVHVAAGEDRKLDFLIDTGIR